MRPERQRSIAVALHDIEPSTFERCALIRDWLDDHGIAKVTLLVIPASDLHHFDDRCPELTAWLGERVAGGDAVAQHGFQHRAVRHGPLGRRGGEFSGLDEVEARRAVDAGRRVLRLAGIQPQGFVAPAYAYTAALQRVLEASFEWWASLRDVRTDQGRRAIRSQAFALSSSSALRRRASPVTLRGGARVAGEVLRLDLHPSDLDHPAHIGAVESVLLRAHRRQAVTYDDLAAAGRPG